MWNKILSYIQGFPDPAIPEGYSKMNIHTREALSPSKGSLRLGQRPLSA